MWLLSFHFQVSVLCALAIFGAFFACWRKIIENGWAKGDGKKRNLFQRFGKFLLAVLYFLILSVIPVINIAAPFIIVKMSVTKKEASE